LFKEPPPIKLSLAAKLLVESGCRGPLFTAEYEQFPMWTISY